MSNEDEQYGTNVTSVEEWGAAGVHNILCPSGTRVDIRIPDLAALIEGGDLPQHLLDAALGVATKLSRGEQPKPSVDMVAKEREFNDFLVAVTVVKPSLTIEQAAKVPYEDKELIVAIATRQRDMDAEYEQIGGLTKSEKYRRFRKLGEFDPALEG
jgi:hypothetical protein